MFNYVFRNNKRFMFRGPVHNSKCVSVLGSCKSNASSILNHRLIHVTFLSCHICVWFYNGETTWATCKNKVPHGYRTHNIPLHKRLFSFLRHHILLEMLSFCALDKRLKEANFNQKNKQNIIHERLVFTIARYWFTLGVRYGSIFDVSEFLNYNFHLILIC